MWSASSAADPTTRTRLIPVESSWWFAALVTMAVIFTGLAVLIVAEGNQAPAPAGPPGPAPG